MPSRATLVKIGIAVGAVIGGSLAGASIAAPIVSLAQSDSGTSVTTDAATSAVDSAAGTGSTVGDVASTVAGTADAVTGGALPQVTRAQTPSTDPNGDVRPAPGPHAVGDCTEASLSSEDEAKVKAAAEKKVPDATVERIETDCDTGSAYEAHMTKSDGSRVTAYVNKDFEVTSVEEGHGGRGGPGRPADQQQSSDATSG